MRFSQATHLISIGFLLSLLVACDSSTPPKPPRQPTPLDLSTVGMISGSVHFEGPAPEQSVLQLRGWSECAAQHEGTVYAGDVLVTNGRLQNALVYIKDGLGGRVFAIPEEPVENDQKGCVFLPRVMGLQVDQPIRYLNSDPMAHNVHGLPRNSSPWNFSLGLKGTSRNVTVDAEEVGIEVKCDIHGWMRSYLGVFDHPYFALSGQDGSFRLQNVPPGEYTIAAWHERFGVTSQKIALPEKGEAEVALTFQAEGV